MASLTERFSGKEPLSYEVTVPVVGGQFLVWDAATPLRGTTGELPKAKVATHGAANWLGMAKYDASPGSEFEETSVAYVNVPINSPVPFVVAVAAFGVYEVVNAGNATLNPGDDVEIVTDDGKPGKATAASASGNVPAYYAMAGGRSVVGISVSRSPAPPGSVFRLRLGRN
jgi:hypothetical protein